MNHDISRYSLLTDSELWHQASGDQHAYGIGFYAASLSVITIMRRHGRNFIVIPSRDNYMLKQILFDLGIIEDATCDPVPENVVRDFDVDDVADTAEIDVDDDEATVDPDIFDVPEALAEILAAIEL